MGWREIQDAFQAAIAAAARIDPGSVIWAWQNVDQPPDPYVRLAMPTILQVGQDFLSMQFDAARVGQEYKVQPQGQREVPLELQVFTDTTADESSAVFLAEQIKTNLLLPSIRAGLSAAGISVFDPGPVNNAPLVVATGFRGRATCTLRSYVPAQACAEFVGYIATVNGTITTSGGGSGATPPLPYSAKIG